MAKAPIKKTKAERIEEIEKIKEFIKEYRNIYFIENSEIPNSSVKKLRSMINGRIVFIKKTMFQKCFSKIHFDQNYFLIFTNDDKKGYKRL